MQVKKTLSIVQILAGFWMGLILQPPSVEAAPKTETRDHCDSSLKLYDRCYDWYDHNTITVYTTNCSPTRTDWIGLYKDTGVDEVGENKGRNYWKDIEDWEFVCGTKTCSVARLNQYNYYNGWWQNLANGDYKLYLFANDGYTVKAESETFTVKKNSYCDNTPTPAPDSSPTDHPTPTPQACRNKRGRFRLQNRKKRTCKWAHVRHTVARCNVRIWGHSWKRVHDICPRACGDCGGHTHNREAPDIRIKPEIATPEDQAAEVHSESPVVSPIDS